MIKEFSCYYMLAISWKNIIVNGSLGYKNYDIFMPTIFHLINTCITIIYLDIDSVQAAKHIAGINQHSD